MTNSRWPASPCPHYWLGWLLIATILYGYPGTSLAQEKKRDKKTVTMVIDYGDGVEKRFKRLTWKQGMTVLDAMNQAKMHRRGIRFESRGKKDTAFLTQIDDLKNEGANGRNWIYRVGGELGDRSFAIHPLEAGDMVLWTFGSYP